MRKRLLALFLLTAILVCTICLSDAGQPRHISDANRHLRIAVHKPYPERRGLMILGHLRHGQLR
jgi:hypothetical protein